MSWRIYRFLCSCSFSQLYASNFLLPLASSNIVHSSLIIITFSMERVPIIIWTHLSETHRTFWLFPWSFSLLQPPILLMFLDFYLSSFSVLSSQWRPCSFACLVFSSIAFYWSFCTFLESFVCLLFWQPMFQDTTKGFFCD